MVTTLSHTDTSHIALGDLKQLPFLIYNFSLLGGGSLQDVLLILEILVNLLSISHIYHSVYGKIVDFSLRDVVIKILIILIWLWILVELIPNLTYIGLMALTVHKFLFLSYYKCILSEIALA